LSSVFDFAYNIESSSKITSLLTKGTLFLWIPKHVYLGSLGEINEVTPLGLELQLVPLLTIKLSTKLYIGQLNIRKVE